MNNLKNNFSSYTLERKRDIDSLQKQQSQFHNINPQKKKKKIYKMFINYIFGIKLQAQDATKRKRKIT